MNYDVHALSVFNDEKLVGHIPIEISSILDYFLQQCPDNFIDAKVAGKRKREVGLVVPADHTAYTKDRETADHTAYTKDRETADHTAYTKDRETADHTAERSGRNTSATSKLLSKIMLD